MRYSVPFPSLSRDPLEQYLVHEAVMERWFSVQAVEEQGRSAEEEAHAKTKAALEEAVGRKLP